MQSGCGRGRERRSAHSRSSRSRIPFLTTLFISQGQPVEFAQCPSDLGEGRHGKVPWRKVLCVVVFKRWGGMECGSLNHSTLKMMLGSIKNTGQSQNFKGGGGHL